MSDAPENAAVTPEVRPDRSCLRLGRDAARLGVFLTALVLVLVMGSTTAMAGWHSSGVGVGTALTGTLVAPTVVTVAPTSDSSVSISWTPSSDGVPPTGYYVTRITGGAMEAACGSSADVLVSVTSCIDTKVFDGVHSYVVTAVFRSWTASSAESSSVAVVTPTQLVFTAAPESSTAGVAITPAVTVGVQSAQGVPVPTAGITVTLAIGANPGSGTLSGITTAMTDSTGVVTFTGLSINKAGAGYTLIAASSGLSPATSPAFSISAGPATMLEFDSTAFSGAASSTASLGPITVRIRDALGNTAAAPPGGTRVGLSSDSIGTAVFSLTQSGVTTAIVMIPEGSSGVSFYYGDTKAGGPKITATGTDLSSASQMQTITAGTATKLLFGQQPTNTKKGMTIRPAVTAQIVDQFGNQTNSTASVAIAIHNNAGGLLTPGSLSGTLLRKADVGVATFDDLSIVGGGLLGIGGIGNGYTLRISSNNLAAVISNPFDIT